MSNDEENHYEIDRTELRNGVALVFLSSEPPLANPALQIVLERGPGKPIQRVTVLQRDIPRLRRALDLFEERAAKLAEDGPPVLVQRAPRFGRTTPGRGR